MGTAKNVTAAHRMVLIYLFFDRAKVFVCINIGTVAHWAARASKPTLTPGRPSPGQGDSSVAPAAAQASKSTSSALNKP